MKCVTDCSGIDNYCAENYTNVTQLSLIFSTLGNLCERHICNNSNKTQQVNYVPVVLHCRKQFETVVFQEKKENFAFPAVIKNLLILCLIFIYSSIPYCVL